MAAGSPEGPGSGDEAMGGSTTVAAVDLELESHSVLPDSQPEYAQASALQSGESESLSSSQTSLSTTRTTDSGFSQPNSSTSCCSLDPHAEKETSCEKAVRPEGDSNASVFLLWIRFASTSSYFSFLLPLPAAVTGYQHPSEAASGHASQFYIALLDSNNKEQRLDEKGIINILLNGFLVNLFSYLVDFEKLNVQFLLKLSERC